MTKSKLSGNNRLPKYWVVQCPEKSNSEELDRFRNTVIRYMEEVIGERWRGDAYLSYYGYDGNSSFRGTNYNCSLKDFINSPTLLTIDEFIELSKPIESTSETKEYSSMNKRKFSVEGSQSLKKAFAEEVGVEFYSPESIDYLYIGYCDNRTLQGWSDKSRDKHFSLPEEWNDAVEFAKKAYEPNIKKEIYFGDLKLTITQGNDYADTEYGKIYKADIEKVVTMFDKKIRILGYYLKVNDIDNIKVSFGCKTDTIGKAREILEMFNS